MAKYIQGRIHAKTKRQAEKQLTEMYKVIKVISIELCHVQTSKQTIWWEYLIEVDNE